MQIEPAQIDRKDANVREDTMNDKKTIEKNDDFFDSHYYHLRLREQRIYTNRQIASLPEIEPGHVHHKEWVLRKKSSDKLISLLSGKKRPLKILEAGCGNGWLSARMAKIPQATVTGIDLNRHELMQAVTTFDKTDNLFFAYGDIRTYQAKPGGYDIIVFASSLQYLPSVTAVMERALSLLAEEGEIHILDTPFYDKNEVGEAAERSRNYYRSLGFEQMTSHYFHHLLSDIFPFNYAILHRPKNSLFTWGKNSSPFYHILIKHKNH